jgi:predicted transcriptional regulator
MGRKSLPELSPLELEVMNVIWELGECTSADVIAEFTKIRKLANTTIRTVLANIRKKGYLEVVPSIEPRIRFRPSVTKRTVTRRTVRQLLSNMFSDSPREAIAFLLEEEKIDAGELAEIRKLLDGCRQDGEED